MENLDDRINAALGAMASIGPRSLRRYLEQPAPDFDRVDSGQVDRCIELILSSDPNLATRLRFSGLLHSWDNAKGATWTAETARNTNERRSHIYGLLDADGDLRARIDALLPYYPLDEPILIAEQHEDWYRPQEGVRDYYWRTYANYLRQKRSWPIDSLLSLDNSTRAIVECLADPESPKAYASRGLVVGYVQSGKTANFTGVVARAADAGYRLIIVLAGTWNILRNQTQRRFDKELLGKELLSNDEGYTIRAPADWTEFLEHGFDPVEQGHFAWQRLTRPDIDFRRLKAAINTLDYERLDKSAPIYSPTNLHALPTKLLVIKKHSLILANLVKDLKLIRTRLNDLPTLIIDDESDQAGLNTADPAKAAKPDEERTKTNRRIVELLELFPRGQYVGYTATPYANALVDPDDPKDLFPKDFILSLPRPTGYMGVSDFFDPTVSFADLVADDYSQPEIAYIRRVKALIDEDDGDLAAALRGYVLSGALKLYRLQQDPVRYKAEFFRHHTMLVHTSPRKGVQESLADRVQRLWDACVFNAPTGLDALEQLWKEDFLPVCKAQGDELVPGSWSALAPYLTETIGRVERGNKIYLVVNSDTKEAPDFSAAPVWKVVIGGNKLSRGYTLEGLTTSYYRRVAGAADTLMQMGRWFGFRPGYFDLVRVYLGVSEGKKEQKSKADLVALFKEACRMEERFRTEIERYVRKAGQRKITPKQIPPLISLSGSLPPTSRNKMFNAVLVDKNYGGQRSMLTMSPSKRPAMDENIETLHQLLAASKPIGRSILGGASSEGKKVSADMFVCRFTSKELSAFLTNYRWLESDYAEDERPADATHQIAFLGRKDNQIDSWLLLAPQRSVSFGPPLPVPNWGSLAVKERHRLEERGFQVFGEPSHRRIADFLAGLKSSKDPIAKPNEATSQLKVPKQGVMLLYPVREEPSVQVSVGFELLFPKNDLPFELNLSVRKKGEQLIVEEA